MDTSIRLVLRLVAKSISMGHLLYLAYIYELRAIDDIIYNEYKYLFSSTNIPQ